MPRKKKQLLKSRSSEADPETSDDQAETTNRALRSRVRTKIKSPLCTNQKIPLSFPTPPNGTKDKSKISPNEEQQQSENGYDADSELDQKQDSCSDSDSAERSYKMAISSDSENGKRGKGRQKLNLKRRGRTGTRCREESFCAPATEKTDKENFTPPDSHSTPSMGQNVVRNLDDSLFGFNRLESPLPFSPVSSISYKWNPSPSRSIKPSLFSASSRKGKRKSERPPELTYESEKKGKKKKSKREPHTNDICLEELREQFREVEMHELVVEYD